MNESARFAGCILSLGLIVSACWCNESRGQDDAGIDLAAPAGWRSETIELPPAFAPDMDIRGVEEIRFAPGMFERDADDFFSYVFVFRFENQEAGTGKAFIQEQMLAYYRGLSRAVLRDPDFDVSGFALELEARERGSEEGSPDDVALFDGELRWIEPFVTRAEQTLHLEIHAWREDEGPTFWFVCVSPKERDDEVWAAMRDIRKAFHESR